MRTRSISSNGKQQVFVSSAGAPLQFFFSLLIVACSTGMLLGCASDRPESGPLAPVATPSSLTFRTMVGATAAQTLTIDRRNLNSVSAFLPAGSDFQIIAPSTCADGATSCQIAVSYSPKSTGTETALLTVTDTYLHLSTTVPLTGNTPLPPALSPGALSFGDVQLGSTSAVASIAAATQDNDLITARFAASSPFNVSTPACTATGCSLAVSFTPVNLGAASATLIVTDTVNGLSSSATVTGNGVPVPVPILTLSVSSLSFGATSVGTTASAQPVTLTNTGNRPLMISSILITGANASDYTQTSNCMAAIASGASCTLSVSFSPTAGGTRSAVLQIVSNASSTPAALPLSGSGTALPANTLIRGANAVIPFTEGTGTTAHDTSGNGNDCTFASGSNSPAWANGGLLLNDNSDASQKFCTLPAGASNADKSTMNSRTLTMCAYFHPVDAPNNRSYAAVFGGSNRLDIGALWLSGAAHVRSAYYVGDYFGYGGIPTYSTQPLVGYHCVTYALGSTTDGTLDHFYIDGAEVNHYGAQGTVWDLRSPGDFYSVGATLWDSGSYLWGTVYYVLAYPVQLTPAAVAQNFTTLQQLAFYSRGVGSLPVQSTTSSNILVANGDSLTNETPNGVTPYPYLLSLNTHFTVTDTGVVGKLLETEVADSPLIDLPLYSPNSPYAFISNAAGINDINIGGSTQAQIIAYRATVNAAYKQQGFTVLSPTMVSSIGADTEVQAIDAALRTAATANGYFLVDWANEPCLGASSAYANPTGCAFFQADGLHPNQNGENEMARLYSNIVNYLTGSTATNPTVVTALAYTLAPADRFLTAQGSTAQTITLPDCYGWSTTTPFTLTNANLTGPVSLATSAGFTLNGATAPVGIPPATTLQLYADLISPTASGCAWHTR